jgi:hypothetical protein
LVRRAAIAEEALRLRISAKFEILETRQAGVPRAQANVAGKVEQGMALAARRRKEARIGGNLGRAEARREKEMVPAANAANRAV